MHKVLVVNIALSLDMLNKSDFGIKTSIILAIE